jgi:hypothetical protein
MQILGNCDKNVSRTKWENFFSQGIILTVARSSKEL